MQTSAHLSVAVLMNHSLLARGIACKLTELISTVHLNVIDENSPDIRQTLEMQSPKIIILDEGDARINEMFSLRQLFEWVPNATVICLSQSSDFARVFTSCEIQVGSAEQLLHILQPSSTNL